ncbi:hypothetical protein IWQ61_010586, partial [Dispira simplex]
MAPNVGGRAAIQWPDFDEEDMESFLEEFEEIAEEHGINGKRRCVKLKYCVPKEKIKEITLYDGYLRGDWEQLKKDLLFVFPQTGSSSRRLRRKLSELTKERWTIDGLRSKVLMYQSLIRATEGADMSNSTQARVLIRTLPKNLERKIRANIVKDGEMPPLAKVAERILAEAANEEYWAEEEYCDEGEDDAGENQKAGNQVSRIRETSKTEQKAEPNTDINQLMSQFEKMSLNLLRIAEGKSKERERSPNCFYCNSPGHRKFDCAEFAKDRGNGLFTVGERGRILDLKGNVIPIDGERGIMYHVRNQRGTSNLVRAVHISPEAATLAVRAEPEEVIEVPTGWDCPVVVNGETYRVKRPFVEEDKIAKKVVIEKETSHEKESAMKANQGKDGEKREKENYSAKLGDEGGFELDPEIRNVVDQVKAAEVRITLEELAQISPMARRGVQSILRPKKNTVPKGRVGQAEAHSEPERETAWKDVLYASGLGTVVGTLEGRQTRFTLDDGSEMNLMASDVAEELAQQGKLVIRKDVVWRVGDINGGQTYTKGVGTHCQVAIGEATVPGHFFVTGTEKGLVLLGAPWQRAARLEKRCGDDGAVWMRVKDYQSNAVVQFCAVPTKHPRQCTNPAIGPSKS